MRLLGGERVEGRVDGDVDGVGDLARVEVLNEHIAGADALARGVPAREGGEGGREGEREVGGGGCLGGLSGGRAGTGYRAGSEAGIQGSGETGVEGGQADRRQTEDDVEGQKTQHQGG